MLRKVTIILDQEPIQIFSACCVLRSMEQHPINSKEDEYDKEKLTELIAISRKHIPSP